MKFNFIFPTFALNENFIFLYFIYLMTVQVCSSSYKI